MQIQKHAGRPRRNAAGIDGDSGWILLDFNEVVVHLFVDDARAFYGLENLWADVPRLDYTPPEPTAADDAAPQRDTLPDLGLPHSGPPDTLGRL